MWGRQSFRWIGCEPASLKRRCLRIQLYDGSRCNTLKCAWRKELKINASVFLKPARDFAPTCF